MLSLLNDTEILSKLPQVTSLKILTNKKFHEEGIFSEQIFGPIESYKCWCETPKVPKGQRCPDCGIVIGPKSLRKKIFAVIELGHSIVSPSAVLLIESKVRLKNIYNKLMSGKYVLLKDSNELVEINLKDLREKYYELEDMSILIGPDAMEHIIIEYMNDDKYKNDIVIQQLYKLIEEGSFQTQYILVIPPHYRPYTKQYMAEINRYYLTILNILKNKPDQYSEITESLIRLELQNISDKILKYILERFSKKTGIFRQKLAGKRLDLSGRAVISPSDIPIEYVGIPRLILLKLYMLDLAKVLVNKYDYIHKDAFQFLEDLFDKKEIPDWIKEELDLLAKDKYILINRQPTLHRGSILSFKILPTDATTIQLNHLVVDPLNADFDGDQMAVYHVENQEEAERIAKLQPFTPANGELQFLPKQDIIYAIYQISKTKEGKEFLSKSLGIEEIQEVDKPIDKKELIRLLKDKVHKDGIDVLNTVKEIGFEYTRQQPNTLNLYDLMITQEKVELDFNDDMVHNINELDKAKKKLKEVFPKRDIIDSGARASYQQVLQTCVARGYVSDFFGNIVPHLIKSSYLDGLTDPIDFFKSNYGTRKGVLDTALNVSETGYLTRRLIYLANSAILSPTNIDCETTHTIKLYVDSEDLARRLIYRYYYEYDPRLKSDLELKKVDRDNYKEIVGKTIYLRSPIHCTSEHYCQTCYGDLYHIHNSKFVGFIAAQTIGERSTQLTLRTFHTGGVAETKQSKNKQEDITTSLKGVESILDRTKQINDLKDVYDDLNILYRIFKEYSDIHLVHLEILLSEKLYRYNQEEDRYIKWRLTNQADLTDTQYVSTKIAPTIQSPILGIFFERASDNLAKAIISTDSSSYSVLDKLLLNNI